MVTQGLPAAVLGQATPWRWRAAEGPPPQTANSVLWLHRFLFHPAFSAQYQKAEPEKGTKRMGCVVFCFLALRALLLHPSGPRGPLESCGGGARIQRGREPPSVRTLSAAAAAAAHAIDHACQLFCRRAGGDGKTGASIAVSSCDCGLCCNAAESSQADRQGPLSSRP